MIDGLGAIITAVGLLIGTVKEAIVKEPPPPPPPVEQVVTPEKPDAEPDESR